MFDPGVMADALPPGECPVCGSEADSFLPFGLKQTPERMCPTCGSAERHRLIWLYLQRHTDIFTRKVSFLHVAPEPFFTERLKPRPNIEYLSVDLAMKAAMVHMDLTALELPDGEFDFVYASHVLEHIPDDRRAMREIFRVLKPGGLAVVPVPVWGKVTKEDLGVTDPKERERLYGQNDHVRLYGHDGEYEQRLRSVGFDVEVLRATDTMSFDDIIRYRLAAVEEIHLARKPRTLASVPTTLAGRARYLLQERWDEARRTSRRASSKAARSLNRYGRGLGRRIKRTVKRARSASQS